MYNWGVTREEAPPQQRWPSKPPEARACYLKDFSVLSNLVQGVPTAETGFLPPHRPHAKRIVQAQQSPNMPMPRRNNFDPGDLSHERLAKLGERLPPPPRLPEPVLLPPRVHHACLHADSLSAKRAEDWRRKQRALSQWDTSDHGKVTYAAARDADAQTAQRVAGALDAMLKLSVKQGRRRGVNKPEPIEGSRPKHPLQNPHCTLRVGFGDARR